MYHACPTGTVLTTKLSLLSYREAMGRIWELVKLDRPSAVSFCNTHLVAEAAENPHFHAVLEKFDLNFPDGMPLKWVLNWHGANLCDRVYGPVLMQSVLAEPIPLRHFLFGSTSQTLEKLVEKQFAPGGPHVVAGTLSPPFRPFTQEDDDRFADEISSANPDCIWVCLGGVRQEQWIAENLHRYKRGVFLAVGDAFSLLAGETRFAPRFMQRAGLTWLFRLSQDPGRLWSRYFYYNLLFLRLLFMAKINARRQIATE